MDIRELSEEQLFEVPLRQRTTLRSLFAIQISKTSLIGLKKANAIWRHTGTVKPYLRNENMIQGCNFAYQCMKSIDSWMVQLLSLCTPLYILMKNAST